MNLTLENPVSNISLTPIKTLLESDQESLLQEWLSDVMQIWDQQYPNMIRPEDTRQRMQVLLRELARLFAAYLQTGSLRVAADDPIRDWVQELSSSHARLGFRPSDTAHFVFALKNILTRRMLRSLAGSREDHEASLTVLDDLLDQLSLLTFNAYVEARERIIAQQSLSLVELSSPVMRLWDQIILLSLVGVIDTVRARQFTERLLEAIARFEARVTIIDVTGVPVFDTGVAKHIMKAIEAAQLLGSRIVMTGLSPDGAQTLTKLNINFANITSRASLRAGLAEALLLVGRRIVAAGDGR